MLFTVTAVATGTAENTYSIDNAMDVLLCKLDEAIDDMENGRVFQDIHSESDKNAWVAEHLNLPGERQIYL